MDLLVNIYFFAGLVLGVVACWSTMRFMRTKDEGVALETAAQFARNADFYRSIVWQIGDLYGEEARTADDGTVHEEPLALKVLELAKARPEVLGVRIR